MVENYTDFSSLLAWVERNTVEAAVTIQQLRGNITSPVEEMVSESTGPKLNLYGEEKVKILEKQVEFYKMDAYLSNQAISEYASELSTVHKQLNILREELGIIKKSSNKTSLAKIKLAIKDLDLFRLSNELESFQYVNHQKQEKVL